jgi:cyclopropane-fatty-acyl-phospholipid synthase
MSYSCGYWQQASDLASTQEAKMDLICRKLGLQKGMRVLDVGCGFGGLAHWMASRYDVNVIAVTVSKNQTAQANTRWLASQR